MATTTKSQTKEKFDIYKDVTRKIVMRLAEGDIPWHKRWCSPLKVKLNYKSRHKYTGVNLLLLQDDGEYLTYNQCRAEGGHVKEGEHGHTIYQHFPVVRKEDEEEYKRLTKAGESTDHIKKIFVLRYLNVFHLSQTEGIKSKLESPEHQAAKAPVDMADFVIQEFSANTGVRVKEHPSDICTYDGGTNTVSIPSRTQFGTEEQWYNTLFSGLAKSVLAKGLEREGGAEGEDPKERKVSAVQEELESEIAACMVMSGVGLTIRETEEDTMAECSRWTAELNKDFRLIVNASAKAQKVAEYILRPIM